MEWDASPSEPFQPPILMGNPKQKREQQVQRYANWTYAQYGHLSVGRETVPRLGSKFQQHDSTAAVSKH
jgi:hypothetical protein